MPPKNRSSIATSSRCSERVSYMASDWLTEWHVCFYRVSLHSTLPHLSHFWQIVEPGKWATPCPNSLASSYTSYPSTHNLPTVHCNHGSLWTLNSEPKIIFYHVFIHVQSLTLCTWRISACVYKMGDNHTLCFDILLSHMNHLTLINGNNMQ